MSEILEGNTRFAAALYDGLAAGSEGNIFFSPFGISSALAMLGAGGRRRQPLGLGGDQRQDTAVDRLR